LHRCQASGTTLKFALQVKPVAGQSVTIVKAFIFAVKTAVGRPVSG
jgi:hypothetical protein